MDFEKQSNFITSFVRCDRHRYYYRCSYRSPYSSGYYLRYRYSTAVAVSIRTISTITIFTDVAIDIVMVITELSFALKLFNIHFAHIIQWRTNSQM